MLSLHISEKCLLYPLSILVAPRFPSVGILMKVLRIAYDLLFKKHGDTLRKQLPEKMVRHFLKAYVGAPY